MKKLNLMLLIACVAALALAFPSNATITGCGLNVSDQIYVQGAAGSSFKFNATGTWAGSASNITNVTFIFTGATTLRITNSTVNGSKTTGASSTTGDFTYTLGVGNLSEGAHTVIAECRNTSSTADAGTNSVNSSSITFTVDRSDTSAVITNPLSGSTVIPSSNYVTFEYTPTDTNLANCSLHLNNVNVKSSTSDTITPNATSGQNNRFTNKFGADNSSVRVAVSCIDLSGRDGGSNNFTFTVLLGGTTAAAKQAQAAAAGGGSGFTAASQLQDRAALTQSQVKASTHLQQYGWIYIVAIVLLIALAIRFKWFK